MAYLPVGYLTSTEFPQEYGADLRTAIQLIDEKWRRFYPRVTYYSLNKLTTNLPVGLDGDVDIDAASGESGGAAFDPLWGEYVDPAALIEGWKQPHLSGDRRAVEPGKWKAPCKVHAQVRREARKNELQKLGFDRVRDLLLTLPVSLLDEAAITVQAGDRFIWDGDWYEVLQFEATGYWKNTNLRIYVVINAENVHPGS